MTKIGQIKKSEQMMKDLRKKNTSVEPPEMMELDFRTHISKKQSNLAKNHRLEDIIMPNYEVQKQQIKFKQATQNLEGFNYMSKSNTNTMH